MHEEDCRTAVKGVTSCIEDLSNPVETNLALRGSLKKGVLRNYAKFIGKHLCFESLFNKVAGLRPEHLF